VTYDELGQLFESLADKRIPGGCPSCDAEQMIQQVAPGGWSLTVNHGDGCPFWLARNAVSN
jgi:hypothetical protein